MSNSKPVEILKSNQDEMTRIFIAALEDEDCVAILANEENLDLMILALSNYLLDKRTPEDKKAKAVEMIDGLFNLQTLVYKGRPNAKKR